MTRDEARARLTTLFLHLRNQHHFGLGVGELLAALEMAENPRFIGAEDVMRQAVGALWCKSPTQLEELEEVWVLVTPSTPRIDPVTVEPLPVTPIQTEWPVERNKREEVTPPTQEPVPPPVDRSIRSLPVQAPSAAEPDDDEPVEAYLPVSARQMRYAWRYLRRSVREGPRNEIDVDATVRKVCRDNIFLEPVLRRREVNRAHLLLLVDQNGSMMPFHRFTRDLVETAIAEESGLEVEPFYFHNVVESSVWRSPFLTGRAGVSDVLSGLTADSSVIVVSDAGASRGGAHNMERISRTLEFLRLVTAKTSQVAWLNPMPRERWPGTSAGVLSKLVPMGQMDPDGLSHAIDAVRGVSAVVR